VAHLLKAFGALEEDVLRSYTRQVSLLLPLAISLSGLFWSPGLRQRLLALSPAGRGTAPPGDWRLLVCQ